jgi:hypothetical protein
VSEYVSINAADLVQAPPPYIPPSGPVTVLNEDGEILCGASITLDTYGEGDFFEKSPDAASWDYAPLDIDDCEDVAQLVIAERNHKKIVALLESQASTLTAEGEEALRYHHRELERVPERREEIKREEADQKRYEQELEIATRCNGTAMGLGILHQNGSVCPRHGNF